MCTSNTIAGTRVVRSWTRRKLRQAIIEALKIRGFDHKGRRLKPVAEIGQRTVGDEVLPELLTGTLSLEALPLIRDIKYDELQRQAAIIVSEVIRICGQR